MKEFKYEIKEHIGTVSTSPDGRYATEVNLISWNDGTPKIDIRSWDKELGRMYKGISLSVFGAKKLVEILADALKEEGDSD